MQICVWLIVPDANTSATILRKAQSVHVRWVNSWSTRPSASRRTSAWIRGHGKGWTNFLNGVAIFGQFDYLIKFMIFGPINIFANLKWANFPIWVSDNFTTNLIIWAIFGPLIFGPIWPYFTIFCIFELICHTCILEPHN